MKFDGVYRSHMVEVWLLVSVSKVLGHCTCLVFHKLEKTGELLDVFFNDDCVCHNCN